MFNKIKKYWNWNRLKNNIKYLIKYDLAEKELDVIFRSKDEAIEDCIYELEEDKEIFKNLYIYNDKDTINLLAEGNKSFARFGDGEISIIEGKDCNFQRYDPVLAKKLLTLLQNKRDDVYIGLNRSYFHTPITYSTNNHRFYRIYGTQYRRFFLNVCDSSNIYLDACCFGGYFRLNDDYDFDSLYKRNKELFKDRKIAIVAGEGILGKLQYDVFELASDKVVIPAPSKNAFDKYDEIIQTITENVDNTYIICLILGQTATVMAADLSELGYVAWDIGHLPKDYDAYMRKLDRTPEIISAYWGADE